ncbi:hypothetical protein THAOC_19903, partial [Thalassiosira oceanica]
MFSNPIGRSPARAGFLFFDRCDAPTDLISPAGKIQHQPPHVIRLVDPLAHHLPTPGGSYAFTTIQMRSGDTGPVTTGP